MANFKESVLQERTRLRASRDDLMKRVATLQEEVADLDHEIAALDAYDSALIGKQNSKIVRGAQQETLLALIGAKVGGMSRGEILDELGIKADKKRSAAVSSALVSMKKAGKLTSSEGRYQTA